MKNLYIILLCLPLIGFGQGWEQIYDEDGEKFGNSVQQTSDGGYIICGGREVGEYTYTYIIKTDEYGEYEWSQTFDEVSYRGLSIDQTLDDGYVICSSVNNSSGFNLTKTDSNGDVEWIQNFSELNGVSVKQTTDGGYIVTGNFSTDVLLLKLNESGQEEWTQVYGGDNTFETGNSVQQTTDGGYVICGDYYDNKPNGCLTGCDVYVIKVDDLGEEEWTQNYGFPGNIDGGSYINQTLNGGYIITGRLGYDIYLLKVNDVGNLDWSQTFGEDVWNSPNLGTYVQQTTDGGYYLTGTLDNMCVVFKTNEYGSPEWYQTFDDHSIGKSGQQTIDGGYIVCGNTDGGIYLIKLDSEGNVETISTIELPTPKSKKELLKKTNILGQENTTIKNQPMIEIYDDGSVEKKYIIE
tara:strand:+ start:116 stop:1339 length:1224 start_codon:yes stop_codon:yes gene_type:complete